MASDAAKKRLTEEHTFKIGGTTITIVPPPPMSKEEHDRRHAAFVRAMAKCYGLG